MGTSSSTHRRTYSDHRGQTHRHQQEQRYTSSTDTTNPTTPSNSTLMTSRAGPTSADNYNDGNYFVSDRPVSSVRPAHTPPPYVEDKQAKKIKNDVNVHRESVRVVVDDFNPDTYLVSFSFDALVDGCFTIFYFAKEGPNCTCTPIYPETYMPRLVSFKKGLGQKFCQPSGTGIDLGFFELDHLSKPSPDETIFPLVISAEAGLPGVSVDSEPFRYHQPMPTNSPHAQITQAVLHKDDEGTFLVRVVKQILWIDGIRYELREIYGIQGSDEAGRGIDDNDDFAIECVICMSKPKDTACLPCRHMCLCGECAKEMRLQSNKCPICRQPVQELMEIKINNDISSENYGSGMGETASASSCGIITMVEPAPKENTWQ